MGALDAPPSDARVSDLLEHRRLAAFRRAHRSSRRASGADGVLGGVTHSDRLGNVPFHGAEAGMGERWNNYTLREAAEFEREA